ncbi:MAG TPA: hypothetical protein VLN48_07660 [Bryobacteraceae bacterium]|nr:hypothetical protein [Bryobacteraceae bacterium]
MGKLTVASIVAILGAFLLLWLRPGEARHPKAHAPAVIRFEPPVQASPPAKGPSRTPPKIV